MIARRQGLATGSILAGLLLSGCVAKTAFNVVTLPVKAGAQAADWATTSGDEADRNRGRDLRKQCKKEYDARYCDKRK